MLKVYKYTGNLSFLPDENLQLGNETIHSLVVKLGTYGE